MLQQTYFPWQQRSYKLNGLFAYHQTLTPSYLPELPFAAIPALAGLKDILAIVKLIQSRPDASRSCLTQSCRCPKTRTGPLT